jgi:hypothetical protein
MFRRKRLNDRLLLVAISSTQEYTALPVSHKPHEAQIKSVSMVLSALIQRIPSRFGHRLT